MDLSLYVPESAAGIVERLPLMGDRALAAGGGDPARGDGGAAIEALLNHASGVAADASGSLYVADRDNRRIQVGQGIVDAVTHRFRHDVAITFGNGSGHGMIHPDVKIEDVAISLLPGIILGERFRAGSAAGAQDQA
jgi:hypothetical protein